MKTDVITVNGMSIHRSRIWTVIINECKEGRYLPAPDDSSPPGGLDKSKVIKIAKIYQGEIGTTKPICFFNKSADDFEFQYKQQGIVTK